MAKAPPRSPEVTQTETVKLRLRLSFCGGGGLRGAEGLLPSAAPSFLVCKEGSRAYTAPTLSPLHTPSPSTWAADGLGVRWLCHHSQLASHCRLHRRVCVVGCGSPLSLLCDFSLELGFGPLWEVSRRAPPDFTTPLDRVPGAGEFHTPRSLWVKDSHKGRMIKVLCSNMCRWWILQGNAQP